MKVLIIGCDRLGAELAYRLSMHGHEVVVIDRNEASFNNLMKGFKGRTHQGDPLSHEVLQRGGIGEADAVAAITDSDTRNYVIGYIAREEFHIPLVVVRNYDPVCQVIGDAMGLQAISSAIWGAEQLEEIICHSDMHSVVKAGGGEVEIYSLRIPKEWDEKPLKDLIGLKDHQAPVILTRAGKSVLPKKDLILKADDTLHVSADHEGIEDLRRRLNINGEGGA